MASADACGTILARPAQLHLLDGSSESRRNVVRTPVKILGISRGVYAVATPSENESFDKRNAVSATFFSGFSEQYVRIALPVSMLQ